MATTGTANRSGNITGGPSGARAWADSIPFTAAVDATVVQTVNGNTSITVPSGATFVRILPPNAVIPTPNPTFSGTLTLKGASGDTGCPISTKYPTEIVWDSATAPSTFVLNASVSCTVEFLFA